MIAGAAVSPKVLASAREMLATRRTMPQSEVKAKGESESAAKAKGRRGT
jgi:hypothetical protein